MASVTMTPKRVHNFNAGPAGLPISVMQRAQSEFLNYSNTGMSVMEMSHRSKPFEQIVNDALASCTQLLNIPDNYTVLLMQGGGTGQFAAVPLNLLGANSSAAVVDYIVTGSWSELAAAEARKYTSHVNIVTTNKPSKYTAITNPADWSFSKDAQYIYYCHNETVNGVEFQATPEIPQQYAHIPLVCDMSSCFMSRPIDISKYGLIYAGAQKNVGPAGLTIVIVRNDLLNKAMPTCPTVLNYTVLAKAKSLYNTPPAYAIYITKLVFEWLVHGGGLQRVAEVNDKKAAMLYEYIDNSTLFRAGVDKHCRSHMNVNFDVTSENGDSVLKQLVTEAEQAGIVGIAGHRSVGGLRASLYNAVSLDDVQALITFLQQFEKQHTSK